MSASSAARRIDPAVPASGNFGPTRRFYDTAQQAWMVKVFPGDYYVTPRTDEFLVTVLGSCVSACIRDPRAGIGGMNHFMLPHGESSRGWGGESMSSRFGNFAMEKLINELIKAGASREWLEIKVFGGGNVTESTNAIGTGNAEFVLRYLEEEGLRCVAQDLGGTLPRRIHYFPATGRVVRRLLASSATPVIVRDEAEYENAIAPKASGGEITLFNEE